MQTSVSSSTRPWKSGTSAQFPFAIVLPPLFKCLVDEESQVRTLAMTLLVDLFRRVDSPSTVVSFKPFLSLWLAYISSAFHSLDPDIRYHGCISFYFVCANLQSLLLEKWDSYFPNGASIVSAFVTVFADLSTTGTSSGYKKEGGHKKRGGGRAMMQEETLHKKDGVQWIPLTTQRSKGVLQSFVSFVNLVASRPELQEHNNINNIHGGSTLWRIHHVPAMDQAPFSFSVGSHTSNALLCIHSSTNAAPNHSVSTIQTWDQAVQLLGKHKHTSTTLSNCPSTLMSTVTQVLEQLRNRFVEIIQYEESMDIRLQSKSTHRHSGTHVPESDLDSLSLLFHSIRQVWFCWCRQQSVDASASIKMIQGIFSLLMESFPLKPKHASQQSQGQPYSTVNAYMACLIFDLGQSMSSVKEDWRELLFSYCIPYLHMYESGYEQSKNIESLSGDYQPSPNRLIQASIEMDSILDIVEKLLLSGGNSTATTTTSQQESLDPWTVLFTEFSNLYFPKDHVPSPTMMKSKSGRKAVGIFIALLDQYFHSGENSHRLHDIMDRMSVLSLYLVSWGGDYPQDSLRVLALFYSIFRHGRIPSVDAYSNAESGNDVAKSVRQSLLLLYKPLGEEWVEDESSLAKDHSVQGQSEKTTFDILPIMGQRLFLSLLEDSYT